MLWRGFGPANPLVLQGCALYGSGVMTVGVPLPMWLALLYQPFPAEATAHRQPCMAFEPVSCALAVCMWRCLSLACGLISRKGVCCLVCSSAPAPAKHTVWLLCAARVGRCWRACGQAVYQCSERHLGQALSTDADCACSCSC